MIGGDGERRLIFRNFYFYGLEMRTSTSYFHLFWKFMDQVQSSSFSLRSSWRFSQDFFKVSPSFHETLPISLLKSPSHFPLPTSTPHSTPNFSINTIQQFLPKSSSILKMICCKMKVNIIQIMSHKSKSNNALSRWDSETIQQTKLSKHSKVKQNFSTFVKLSLHRLSSGWLNMGLIFIIFRCFLDLGQGITNFVWSHWFGYKIDDYSWMMRGKEGRLGIFFNLGSGEGKNMKKLKFPLKNWESSRKLEKIRKITKQESS